MSKPTQIIAFDVDGTLIDKNDQPRYDVIDLLKAFSRLGFPIVVWSGGGVDYAERWVERLDLETYVMTAMAKDMNLNPAIAVDDAVGADLGHIHTLIV